MVRHNTARLAVSLGARLLDAVLSSTTSPRLAGEALTTVEDVEVDYMEQQTVAMADVLLSPSAYLLSWMEREGWTLPSKAHRVRVQPYIMPSAAREAILQVQERNPRGQHNAGSPQQNSPVRELVFFGRLERRKGLVLFCDAVDELIKHWSPKEGSPQLRITFLGSARGMIDDMNGGEYARSRAEAWGDQLQVNIVILHHMHWMRLLQSVGPSRLPCAANSSQVQVLTDRDQYGALKYLTGKQRVAIMPSLVDNSPLSILECIGAKVRFLASTAGGIPELVNPEDHSRFLFDPTLPSLVGALVRSPSYFQWLCDSMAAYHAACGRCCCMENSCVS
eukprot:scaffold3032_cov375-Prasinococcus_capsulatus_cf.AAC.15